MTPQNTFTLQELNGWLNQEEKLKVSFAKFIQTLMVNKFTTNISTTLFTLKKGIIMSTFRYRDIICNRVTIDGVTMVKPSFEFKTVKELNEKLRNDSTEKFYVKTVQYFSETLKPVYQKYSEFDVLMGWVE